MNHGGKGSSPRPIEIPRDQFKSNFDRTFGTPVTCPRCGAKWRIKPDVPHVHACTPTKAINA